MVASSEIKDWDFQQIMNYGRICAKKDVDLIRARQTWQRIVRECDPDVVGEAIACLLPYLYRGGERHD